MLNCTNLQVSNYLYVKTANLIFSYQCDLCNPSSLFLACSTSGIPGSASFQMERNFRNALWLCSLSLSACNLTHDSCAEHERLPSRIRVDCQPLVLGKLMERGYSSLSFDKNDRWTSWTTFSIVRIQTHKFWLRLVHCEIPRPQFVQHFVVGPVKPQRRDGNHSLLVGMRIGARFEFLR